MRTLEGSGLSYFYMGELGGRPKAAAFLTGGKPDYAKMPRNPAFGEGIAGLLEESAKPDPIYRHRFLLVARHPAGPGIAVLHILADGDIEPQSDTEQRLVGLKIQADLFG